MTSEGKIIEVTAREILDSRGNPTVEAEVTLAGGVCGTASVPSGASTGSHEACELRDGDSGRFGGKGVLKAVESVNGEINDALRGVYVTDQRWIDGALRGLDGTENKSRLGANAILAVSLAAARAGAELTGMPLYRYLGGAGAMCLPMPMMNVINGGAHAQNDLDIQEFMIVPVGAGSFREAVRMCAEVFHALRGVVKSSGVGDEGGYAPELDSDERALAALMDGVRAAGYEPGRDFMFALDAAASEWMRPEDGMYYLKKRKEMLTREDLLARWRGYAEHYPIISIEDGFGEEDWGGWQLMTKAMGERMMVVGDDLFVTDPKRISYGASLGAGNTALIKMNQIGSISETLEAIETAKRAGFGTIISHRSGETEDTAIADLAVASNAGFIKSGAPSRTDRTAKYNRLMRIEEELGDAGVFGNMAQKFLK